MTAAMLRLPEVAGGDDAFLVAWAEGELRRSLGRLAELPIEIFAQGSRVNGTAVEQGSDIDLVLMLTAAGVGDGYGWEEFRDDVLATLGESHVVRMGRRCLNVDDPGSLFGEMVDVLVAVEHGPGGVFFRDLEGRPIVNFPKQHRVRGNAKDARTGGRFKQAVRAAKRARTAAGLVDAPSYLLECLLFTVPDHVYRTGSPLAWLQWCHREDPPAFAGLLCQNGINRIFGPGPDQWTPATAARIIDVLHEV
ncbi:nucleotidyltransferase domain-containing protein [Actinoplanes sp. RD1]|uniref:nucleotidyltransferase domain-containing protein n=1 Tax=Actinoplanes sp. RD1 TaxID=3064538 RepID=UPI00274293E9|nr:nucleotidyltransferase [Actinoplanes sp. RD1]